MSEAKPKLLIVDDDKGIQRQLRWSFDDYQVAIAGDRDAEIARRLSALVSDADVKVER